MGSQLAAVVESLPLDELEMGSLRGLLAHAGKGPPSPFAFLGGLSMYLSPAASVTQLPTHHQYSGRRQAACFHPLPLPAALHPAPPPARPPPLLQRSTSIWTPTAAA